MKICLAGTGAMGVIHAKALQKIDGEAFGNQPRCGQGIVERDPFNDLSPCRARRDPRKLLEQVPAKSFEARDSNFWRWS